MPKVSRPERYGHAWWIERDGKVLIERRPAKGLLGGMMGLPGTEWASEPFVDRPDGASLGSVTHVFTHFRLTLTVERLKVADGEEQSTAGQWWPLERIGEAGLPTLFAKVARAVMEGGDD